MQAIVAAITVVTAFGTSSSGVRKKFYSPGAEIQAADPDVFKEICNL